MRLGTYYRAQMLKLFDIQATGNRVLDVGGYDGYWFSTQKAKNKYVLDLDVKQINRNVKYIKASALDIPFQSIFFDQVFAFDVLEHIQIGKESVFIKELIRVCKKGGELILSTPSKSIRMVPAFMTNYISHKWGHDKCHGYAKKELTNFFSVFDDIQYEILDNNAPNFRSFFIPVRSLWFIWKELAKIIVKKMVLYDFDHKEGNEGFYFIKISKK